MDQAVRTFIDRYPFKSINKVWPAVHTKYPAVIRKHVVEYLKTKGTDNIPRVNKNYQRITYTNYVGGWQMDLFVLNRCYYLFCINVNNRYLHVGKQLLSKDVGTVLPEIKVFVNKYKPATIICDYEGAFTAKHTVDYLKSKGVKLKVITEQLHSSLGVLNRACRTMRDMMANSNKSIHAVATMYNGSVHSSIGMFPKTMLKHPDIEQLYIINCLLREEGIVNQNDYDIPVGTKCRYIVDNTKRFNKVRNKISVGYYRIDSLEGNGYVIIAKDGTTKRLPRHRLVILKDTETNIPEAATIEDSTVKRGNVEEIIDYNHQKKQYKVKFAGGDIDTIPVRNMREHSPTNLSILEKRYFAKHKNKYKVNGIKISLCGRNAT